MAKPQVLIVRAPGTNCDQETQFAFERAGADTQLLHINRLLESPAVVSAAQIICIPGGFSYGDDIAAGRILGNQFRHHLAEVLRDFREDGKLILGICNGFQVLVKSGLLLEETDGVAPATLAWNDSGRFEDRWVNLAADSDKCVFLNGVSELYLPVAHAEGKFVTRSSDILDQLRSQRQDVLRYCVAGHPDRNGGVPYPQNPNGSTGDIAGVCDESGRVFGLMPHPERFIDPTQHPRWTRWETLPAEGEGLVIFRNAVNYFG